MASPVKPESAPAAPSGTPIPTAAELELQRQRTQQTPNLAPPATEAGRSVEPSAPTEPSREQRLLAAQEQMLRDQAQQIKAMQGRLEKMEAPPPVPTADQDRKYWESPTTVIKELLAAELEKTVAPINARLNTQTSESEYDKAKKKLREEYKDIWDKIEPSIDQWSNGHIASGQPLTEDLLNIAAMTASGAYYRGKLGNGTIPMPAPAPAPAPTPSGGIVTTPPHLRPSAPVIPGHESPAPAETRELTENERRLAKERGQTPAQYLEWIDVKPEDVVKSKIGRAS